MKTFVRILALAALFCLCAAAQKATAPKATTRQENQSQSDWSQLWRGVQSEKPKDGFVPDKATATRIAEAVLTPIYGEKATTSNRPFEARLENGVWTVKGSKPGNAIGGVAVVRISKADGRILFVVHWK